MNVSRKGLFIVFEGLDGAGTTTQTRLLAARLAQRTPTVMTAATAEPSTGPAGSVIRQVLRHRVRGTDCFGKDKPFDPGALALLFAADRLDHYSCEIEPVLDSGGVAISDRYKLSSLAYQALDVPFEWIASINSLAPEPDLLFFLDVSPEVAWNRVSMNRITRDIFEVPEILRQVHANYNKALERMDRDKVVIIPGETPADSIADIVWHHVAGRIPAAQGGQEPVN
ncbi:MAG TPA: dTMP kinase [Myxococcota bacterium]|nr:dTMP kinase [Myxococcota bacterium]HOA12446.1 dTMP kinase [Myxococcota bacterium]HOC99841.1 dTMP kinase [Myxococcota bacterium]HOH75751.1 dTMP kinase [Myxococcota bacterium]HPV03303.1 dTMP kinase [Myxococcota bacterium]